MTVSRAHLSILYIYPLHPEHILFLSMMDFPGSPAQSVTNDGFSAVCLEASAQPSHKTVQESSVDKAEANVQESSLDTVDAFEEACP